MRILNRYTLFINDMTKTAFYGGSKFDARISKATLGKIYDCNLSQLKANIKILLKEGYIVSCMKH